MIDLSFLTEEEQEKIRDVLNRDAELKKCEERRVQNLQRTVSDRERLRFLTGEWFYETKQRRHQDRIHGSEIIRASMRHSHRPITILELSQILPEKPSFVDSENREVFVPPVLCGVLQEPRSLPGNSRCQQFDEPAEEDSPRPALTSPSKRRRNPFNVVETPCGDETDVELSAGRPEPNEGNDDISSPVMSALKRLSSRSNNTSSKSLENLNSPTGSLVKSQQTRSSTSVTLLQHDETDSDSLLESSLGYRRNTGSSVSNLSLSSGITSTSSVSSLQAGEVHGSVQLAVNFIQRLEEFHVFVVLCRDLAVADAKRNVSDPYVKCYLVPDKTKLGKRKTSVKKKTTNPTFNEILRFKVLMEVLKSQTLNVSVWHNNTFGRNSFLGDVDVDLSTWDFSNTHINEYVLKARNVPATPSCLTDSRGRMRVALRFLPQTSHSRRTSRTETGEVQIWVKDCKDLPPVRGVVIDPFVKCAVLPDTSQKSRQKTRVVKRTANPMFNHTMVYDGFRPDDLREACVEVTVWDHDRLNNHYIGGVRLGLGTGKSYGADVVWMDSTSDEASLWRRMLASDGDWVEDVLPLRMLLMAKSTSK